MKFLSLIFTLLFSVSVLANDNGARHLQDILNDYQYSLTVEWDQKDKFVFEQIQKDFSEKLTSVFQSEEITESDLESILTSNQLNQVELAALKLKIKMLSSDPQKLFADSRNLFQTGASWNGEVVMISAGVVLAIALVTLGVWFGMTHQCTEYAQRWECDSFLPREPQLCSYKTVCVNWVTK